MTTFIIVIALLFSTDAYADNSTSVTKGTAPLNAAINTGPPAVEANTEENLRTPKAQAKKKARTAKIKTNDPLENRPNPLPGGVPRPDPIPLCKKPPCAVKEGPEMKPGLTLPAGNAQTRSKESR